MQNQETPAGAVDGVNAVFTCLFQISAETVIVDRLVQLSGFDYTVAGATITFLGGSIPQPGATVRVSYTPVGTGSSTPSTSLLSGTAGAIINDAAVELGLIADDLPDPYASTDPNVKRLCRYLKSEGQEIVRSRLWTQSQIECTFTTIQGQAAYSLPADFLRMIPQTGWNRTNRLPLGGPLDASEWQYLKARLVGVVFTVLFRPKQGQLYLYPDTNTPGGQVIAFEYMSRLWVQPNGSSSATSDVPTASSDLVLFDPLMMMSAVKRAFKKNSGFDFSAEQDDFDRRLALAMAVDSPPLPLSLSGRPFVEPLIGPGNLPVTGYGS